MPQLSAWGRAQQAPPLRTFASFPSDAIKMANGFPHPELFGLKRITVEYKDGTAFELGGTALDQAQQYAPTNGFEPLRRWLEEWTKKTFSLHDEVRCTMTCGNFDGMARTLDVMLDPDTDALFVDAHSFPHSMNILAPWASARNVELVEVPLQKDGLDANEFEKLIQRVKSQGRVPKALLSIPSSQNPTTIDTTVERLRLIYDVASRHDLWIIEDDPYFLTRFVPPATCSSFLALDKGQGRVVRLDSFSKWLAPGWRLGWITAHPSVLQRIAPLLAFPSTMSQVMAHKLLDTWGEAGLAAHLQALRATYRRKCDRMHALLTREFQRPAEEALVRWHLPTGGMFFWLTVVSGPWEPRLRTDAGASDLCLAMREYGVTAVPGSFFRDGNNCSSGLRLTFVSVDDEDMDVGVRRLGRLLRLSGPEES